MEYRELGATGLKISAIGFGCFPMGGGWGEKDDKRSIDAIRKSFDLGVTLYDTANAYGMGHSETLLAKALGKQRKDAVIATKVGLHWDDRACLYRSSSRYHIMLEVESSLKRLKTDYIDIYQIHWPDLNTPFETTMKAMEDLVKSGKVRYIGVSNFNVAQMKECINHGRIHSLQPPYNMLMRDIEKSIIPFCKKNGIGVLSYGTLGYGLLTGKYNTKSKFPDNDWRSGNMIEDAEMWQPHVDLFIGKRYRDNIRSVNQLKMLAKRQGIPMSNLAIAWALSRPGISCALVGAKNAEQAEENAKAADVVLSRDDLREINSILKGDG